VKKGYEVGLERISKERIAEHFGPFRAGGGFEVYRGHPGATRAKRPTRFQPERAKDANVRLSILGGCVGRSQSDLTLEAP
jgi:hypothetical protein